MPTLVSGSDESYSRRRSKTKQSLDETIRKQLKTLPGKSGKHSLLDVGSRRLPATSDKAKRKAQAFAASSTQPELAKKTLAGDGMSLGPSMSTAQKSDDLDLDKLFAQTRKPKAVTQKKEKVQSQDNQQ